MFVLLNAVHYFQVFEDVIQKDYNFIKWRNFGTIYTIYLTYTVGRSGCAKLIETKEAKRLLEIVKHEKFDVIVQDITLNQCLYSLWEVKKNV